MRTSENTDKIFPILLQISQECPVMVKTATNPHFNSSFVPLPDMQEQLKPILYKHGCFDMQPTFATERAGDIGIETIIIHGESGQFVASEIILSTDDTNPQRQCAGITYARRYGMSSLLGLVSDEDDDGNKVSKKSDRQSSSQEKVDPNDPFKGL